MSAPTAVRVAKQSNLGNSFATVHTVYPDRVLEVTCLHIVNTAAVATTVRVCLVPAAGTAEAANALAWDFNIPPNDLIELGDGLLFPGLSSLAAMGSIAGNLNLFLSGLET